MKPNFTLSQIAIVALVVIAIITMGAIYARYPILIQLQCGSGNCGLVIDGKES